MEKKFSDFMETFEYADPTCKEDVDISSTGWCINYISSTFLNGWVNYSKPLSAFVVHRYHDHVVELRQSVEKFHKEAPIHVDLNQFGDDVLILSKDKSGNFWYFHFDQDVSDCSIGKFSSDMSDSDTIKCFEEFVKEYAENVKNYHGGESAYFPLHVHKILGGITF